MQVLIVEDNDVVAQGLSRALAMLDSRISVYRAADLQSAQKLLQDGPRIDVALVDLGLPDATGIEAPTKLKIFSSMPTRNSMSRAPKPANGSAVNMVIGCA